jgi:hypothetical protein
VIGLSLNDDFYTQDAMKAAGSSGFLSKNCTPTASPYWDDHRNIGGKRRVFIIALLAAAKPIFTPHYPKSL